MFSWLIKAFRKIDSLIVTADARLSPADDVELIKLAGLSGSFEPTARTAILNEEADWDLPEGLEEMTVVVPNGGSGGIRHAQLSDKFEGVVVKRLSAVEVDPAKSHQHEFNGSAPLRSLLGQADRKHIPAQFVRVDGMSESAKASGELSWYDARRNHRTRTEYRLYYPSNEVTQSMLAGDIFFLALAKDGSALVIAATPDSPAIDQLYWLFGLEDKPEIAFSYHSVTAGRVLRWASPEV